MYSAIAVPLALMLAAAAGLLLIFPTSRAWALRRIRSGTPAAQAVALSSVPAHALRLQAEDHQHDQASSKIDPALAAGLRRICELVESGNRDRRCTVAICDPEKVSIIAVIAAALPAAFTRAIERSAGPVALLHGEHVRAADIASDVAWTDWRELALSHGLRSSWSSPVRDASDRTIAVLTVYSLQSRQPSPDDLQVLQVAARLAGDTFERSRIDSVRRDSLTRLQLAHSIASLGYWERDLIRNRTVSFGEMSDIVGPPDAQGGVDFSQLMNRVVPEDRHLLLAANAEVTANNPHLSEFTFRVRQADGAVRHILAQRRGLRDESGRIVRVVGTMQDVTAQHRAAASLQASEERFRLVAEQTGQLIIDCSIASGEVNCAGAVREILGNEVGAAQKLSLDIWRKVVHPDDVPLIEATIRRMLRGERISVACRIMRFDGRVLDVEAMGSAIMDEQGRAARIIATVSNISDRRRAEAEGRQYLKQLAFLADAARKVNSVVSVVDLLQIITDIARDLVNSHVAIGVVWPDEGGRSGLQSSSASDKYSSLGGDGIVAAMLASPEDVTAGSGGATTRRSRAAMRDDEACDAADVLGSSGVLTVPLVTPAGHANGLIRVADKREGDFNPNDERVLSQLANLAAVGIENARLYSELEARVGLRTQELEESNRELEAFSYSVSHDLRGPLRAISGFNGLLRERHFNDFDADSRRYIERIDAATQRMSVLIDDLLELGRVTRLELNCERVDLSALVDAAAQRLHERSPERVVTFNIERCCHVWADLRLLEIVLENLLDNAWKFTAGRPNAEVTFATRQFGTDRAFLVRDNGVGFDSRYAANLFGVFQRLHSTADFPGTGVGLATVQRIVQRHGGRIWAEAEVDRGATFYFTLAEEQR